MKVNEILVEVDASYFQRLSDKLSNMNLNDALRLGNTNSNIRDRAEDFINLVKKKILGSGNKITQSNTERFIKEIVYGEMKVRPNTKSEKAIQELVDLVDTNQIDTNVAKTYMTQLVTMSLMKPQDEKMTISYGEYLPMEMLETGSVVPIKYVKLKNNTNFIKFNGTWYKDIDSSNHQVKLHREPVVDGVRMLDHMRGFGLPMRLGSDRTLEMLSKPEMDNWFSEYESI